MTPVIFPAVLLEFRMGLNLDVEAATQPEGFRRALARNLVAQRFAIDAYRQIAEVSGNHGEASLRLARVALAVEEEHGEILSSLIQRFGNITKEAS
jgi:bacterioferritin (cytochrome b1)